MVRREGSREVEREIEHYNLDAKAGYIVDKNNPTIKDRLGMAGVAGLFFGGIGAGVGAAAGTSIVIYRVPASVPAKKADLPTAAR
jgi:hypothetical protein